MEPPNFNEKHVTSQLRVNCFQMDDRCHYSHATNTTNCIFFIICIYKLQVFCKPNKLQVLEYHSLSIPDNIFKKLRVY